MSEREPEPHLLDVVVPCETFDLYLILSLVLAYVRGLPYRAELRKRESVSIRVTRFATDAVRLEIFAVKDEPPATAATTAPEARLAPEKRFTHVDQARGVIEDLRRRCEGGRFETLIIAAVEHLCEHLDQLEARR